MPNPPNTSKRPTSRPVWYGLFLVAGLIAFGLVAWPLQPPEASSAPVAATAPPAPAAADNSAVILIYHHFGKDSVPSTNIRLAQFDDQLDYLAENDFHVWSLSQLIKAFKNQTPIPDKTVVFTVDDAWISVYQEAIPRFKARGWPMTVFVNTDAIDQGYTSSMTWEQMREVQGDGIEFVNHSRSHDPLIRRSDESDQAWRKRVREEINGAQQRLQTELGAKTNQTKLLSYPYGEFSETLANLVKEMGYVGIAQNSGAVNRHSDLRALMRFPMSEAFADMEAFKQKVNAVVLPVENIEPFDPIIRDNPPHLTLSFTEPPGHNIQCFNPQGERLQQQWLNDTTLEIWDENPIPPPRSRYACTQLTQDGRWRWFSHSWVVPKAASAGLQDD